MIEGLFIGTFIGMLIGLILAVIFQAFREGVETTDRIYECRLLHQMFKNVQN